MVVTLRHDAVICASSVLDGCLMIDLRVLGSLELRSSGGESLDSVLSQPKRAALLVYLVLARPRGFQRRDSLVAMFWSELDAEHARSALRQSIYQLRLAIGDDVVKSRGQDELGVDPSRIRCDALELEAALEGGREEPALDLYRGDLLEGFYIRDAPEFEQWLGRQRARLRAQACAAAWTVAERYATQGRPAEAVTWAERALDLSADDEAALQRLLRLQVDSGDRAGAVRSYEAFAARLRSEYELEPSLETRAVLASLREDGARPQRTVFAPSDALSRASSRTADLPVGRSAATAPAAGVGPPSRDTQRGLPRVTSVGLALAGVLAVGAMLWQPEAPDGTGRQPFRIATVELPDTAPLYLNSEGMVRFNRVALAMAPNGSAFVYVAGRGSTTQLYLRRLDDTLPRALAGTDSAYEPFFSPDSRWVGFFVGPVLKKLSVEDGRVVVVAHLLNPAGASWANDGRILVADDESRRLVWVGQDGEVRAVSHQPRVRYVFMPELSSDARWVLHGSLDGGIYVTSLETGESFVLTRAGLVARAAVDARILIYGQAPRFVSTSKATGHIIYSLPGGSVMALPFDMARRRVLGAPFPVLQSLAEVTDVGGGALAFSADGTLVYAEGAGAGLRRFAWVDSMGHVDTLAFPPARFGAFDLSPDGTRIVVRVEPPGSHGELWVMDIRRGTHTVLPISEVPGFVPHWWPDGKRVVFDAVPWQRDHFGPAMRIDESGVRDTLVASSIAAIPSPDGSHVAVGGYRPGLWLVPRPSGRDSAVQLSKGFQTFASFSPDGQWIAFSDPSVTWDVYAVEIAHPERRYELSNDGGAEPVWSPDGRQIFYRCGARLMVVDVRPGREPRFATPRLLVSGPFYKPVGRSHAVAPSGDKHLVLLATGAQRAARLQFVTGWFDHLSSLASR